ncbi:alpha/beta fold hydrolase [Paenibacillus agricola]|uniref:Alpha/beta hydrolase n=1 Tax=Paenibacillus agricola TaxID=2716264 RepID=A0ABX0IZE8_9BACL|nr:alpha/beta hydrolase [Paenibacillus agricola]NHN29354.1 alpha/beta hydrolase [Paenibacillus agricola]
MENNFFAVDGGAKVSYREQGHGKVILLLHGFCGSSAYWDELSPLLPEGYRWMMPDLRGHGESGAPAGDYTMDAFAADLAQMIKGLELEPVVMLGHSLGGYITLAFAERYPELLSGFGLIHSTGFPDNEAGKEGRLKSITTIEEQGLPAFIEGLIPKLFAPEHLASMPEAVAKAKRIGEQTDSQAAIRTLQGMRSRPDRNHVLAEAKIPVLLIAGEQDQIIPVERTFSVSSGLITQVQIPSAAHMSMVEAPQALLEAIETFLAKE